MGLLLGSLAVASEASAAASARFRDAANMPYDKFRRIAWVTLRDINAIYLPAFRYRWVPADDFAERRAAYASLLGRTRVRPCVLCDAAGTLLLWDGRASSFIPRAAAGNGVEHSANIRFLPGALWAGRTPLEPSCLKTWWFGNLSATCTSSSSTVLCAEFRTPTAFWTGDLLDTNALMQSGQAAWWAACRLACYSRRRLDVRTFISGRFGTP